jgi:hypothetical protein
MSAVRFSAEVSPGESALRSEWGSALDPEVWEEGARGHMRGGGVRRQERTTPSTCVLNAVRVVGRRLKRPAFVRSTGGIGLSQEGFLEEP